MAPETQSELRAAALHARRSLDAEARDEATQRIVGHFLRSAFFFKASAIGCFLSMPDEVGTSALIARAWSAKKRIYCPVVAAGRRLRFVEVTRNSALRRSGFGLLEPIDGDEIDPLTLDVVVTPVVAFDADGHRIGMGGGYYDRTFAELRNRRTWLHPKLVGVAFSCQKVQKIKANPWDIALHTILTESI